MKNMNLFAVSKNQTTFAVIGSNYDSKFSTLNVELSRYNLNPFPQDFEDIIEFPIDINISANVKLNCEVILKSVNTVINDFIKPAVSDLIDNILSDPEKNMNDDYMVYDYFFDICNRKLFCLMEKTSSIPFVKGTIKRNLFSLTNLTDTEQIKQSLSEDIYSSVFIVAIKYLSELSHICMEKDKSNCMVLNKCNQENIQKLLNRINVSLFSIFIEHIIITIPNTISNDNINYEILNHSKDMDIITDKQLTVLRNCDRILIVPTSRRDDRVYIPKYLAKLSSLKLIEKVGYLHVDNNDIDYDYLSRLIDNYKIANSIKNNIEKPISWYLPRNFVFNTLLGRNCSEQILSCNKKADVNSITALTIKNDLDYSDILRLTKEYKQSNCFLVEIGANYSESNHNPISYFIDEMFNAGAAFVLLGGNLNNDLNYKNYRYALGIFEDESHLNLFKISKQKDALLESNMFTLITKYQNYYEVVAEKECK